MLTNDTRALAVAALEYYLKRYKDWAIMSAPDGDEGIEAKLDAIEFALADLAVAGGQAAQVWLPLPDGEYGNVEVEGGVLVTWFCDNKIKAFLPDDIRLCRLAPVTQGVAVPEGLRYIIMRYSQDHSGEDHQKRVQEVRIWLDRLGDAPAPQADAKEVDGGS